MYMPFFYMTLCDPDTIMTALHQAQQITSDRGQDYVVLTVDLQLYRVAVNILWACPDQFDNVGSIGSLMAERGLYELLDSTIAGVQKMMTGRKFPQDMRALSIVAEELLILTGGTVNDMHGLKSSLSDISSRSKTSHLWIDM